ncbi:MAG: LPXTG cell wall anchor domain-containing protein [Acidimicrobiia bacterium]
MTALVSPVRRLGAAVTAVLVAAVGAVVVSASPAGAAGAYEGSRSPLAYGGTDYVDTGSGDGALYYDGTNDAIAMVGDDYAELDIVDGTENVHVALVSSGGMNQTIYLTAAAFDDAPGGPFTPNCANLDTLYFGGGPACVAFKPDVFYSNGDNRDYNFTGLGGFVDASDNPLGGDPTVAAGNVDPPEIRYTLATYYDGSASPFVFDGADYDTSPDFSGSGAHWWAIDGDDAPAWIQTGHAPVPGLPSTGPAGIPSVHGVLVDVFGEKATLFVEDTFLGMLDPMNPFSADCPGFDALYETVTAPDPPPITCDAFVADMWAPPNTLGETYTCAAGWYDAWTDENGDPIARADAPTVIDGYEIPALTLTGETTGPGVCAAAPPPGPPPDPPDPPFGPPLPPPPGGGDTGAGGTGTGAGTGSVPTLPATGVGTPALLAVALGVLVVGTGLSFTARLSTRRLRHARR